MRPLLRKQIDWAPLRFAMDAEVCDGIEPDLCGGVEVLKSVSSSPCRKFFLM